MIKKYASSATGTIVPHGSLARWAHRHNFEYQPRPGFLYIRSRAISSRTNDNFDTFPADELRQSWASFVGKPVFVNHHNEDHRRMRGVIIDAALHDDTAPDGTEDTWVEVLMEIDALSFPLLAAALIKRDIERTSMGTDVVESECSFCGNVARTPEKYCAHVRRMKGQRLRRVSASGDVEDVLVHEVCFTPDTMVRMGDGSQVPISLVKSGDEVIDHMGDVRFVTETMTRSFDGRMVSIQVWGHPKPIVVTDNHPVLVLKRGDTAGGQKKWMRQRLEKGRIAPQFVPAGQVAKGDFVVEVVGESSESVRKIVPSEWGASAPIARPHAPEEVPDRFYTPARAWGGRQHILRACRSCGSDMDLYPSEADRLYCSGACFGMHRQDNTIAFGYGHQLPDSLEMDSVFGRWCGWFLAEGSVHPASVRFSLNATEVDHAAEIDRLGSVLFGLAATHRVSGNGRSVEFHSANLSRFMECMGTGFYTKALPDEWLDAPIDFIGAVVDAHHDGDGEHGGGRSGGVQDESIYQHATSSPRLADQLYYMHLRLGHTPTCKLPDPVGGASKRTVPGYSVRTRLDRDAKGRLRMGNWVFAIVHSVDTAEYTGPVHNLGVSDTHTYVAGNVAVHNCRGLSFFENSLLVEEPADPTAFTFGLDTRGIDIINEGLSAEGSRSDPMIRTRQDAATRRRLREKWLRDNPSVTPEFCETSGQEWYPVDGDGTIFCRSCGARLVPLPLPDSGDPEDQYPPEYGTVPQHRPGTSKTAAVEMDEIQRARFKGTTVAKDKDGFYCRTHRCRSESYPSVEEIPDSAIEFIEATGRKHGSMSAITATGICGRCHERKDLVGHGNLCQECLDALVADSKMSSLAKVALVGTEVYGPFPPVDRAGPARYSKNWIVRYRSNDVIVPYLFANEEDAVAFATELRSGKSPGQVDQSSALLASKTQTWDGAAWVDVDEPEVVPDSRPVYVRDLSGWSGDDRSVEVWPAVGGGFIVTVMNDGIGFNLGGDVLGIGAKRFPTLEEAKAAADGRKTAASDLGVPGESRAPAMVQTLRPQQCPVCESDAVWNSDGRCDVCGYLPAPKPFRAPDTDVAGRADQSGGWFDPELTRATPFTLGSNPVKHHTSTRKGQRPPEGETTMASSVAAAARQRMMADQRLAQENQRLRQQVATLTRRADIDNPAQPVAEPAPGAPVTTTQQQMAQPTKADVGTPGGVIPDPISAPGNVQTPGGEIPDSAIGGNVDLEVPVAGTTEPDPNAVIGVVPDASGETFGDPAFQGDWINPGANTVPDIGGNAATAASRRAVIARITNDVRDRIWASMHLARLRTEAGIADDNDQLVVARRIEASNISMDAIRAETSALTAVASRRPRGPVRTAAVQQRTPSLAGGVPVIGSLGQRPDDEALFE